MLITLEFRDVIKFYLKNKLIEHEGKQMLFYARHLRDKIFSNIHGDY